MLLTLILLPIVAGLIQYVFPFKLRVWYAFVVQLGLNLWLIYTGFHYEAGYLQLSMTPLPFGMVLNLDHLSYVMLLLNNLIFMMMTLFNRQNRYMDPLFLFLFMGLQGLINGVFLSYDMFNAYLLIEVSTVTVSILIMYKRDSRSMYDGMIYLLTNMFAMVFFLMGVGFLYKYFGLLDFKSLQTAIGSLSDKSRLILPYAFIITGVSLKAAIMPLFSWLPKAHGTPSAPSVVSAVLSGVYVKTGIYLLIRMNTIFAILDLNDLFILLGLITALLGYLFAIAQKDIKLILAYSTIAQVGLILMGISSIDAVNQAGGLYLMFNHGIFKALLFLSAGLCIEAYKTRDITKMHYLWGQSKFLSLVLLVGLLGITGMPFFSGSYAKYFISYGASPLMSWAYQLLNLGTVFTFMKFFILIFKKGRCDQEPVKIKLKSGSVITLTVLALAVIGFGVFGDYLMPWLTQYNASLNLMAQATKIPNYLVIFILGFGLYKLTNHENFFIKAFRSVDLGFNSIAATVVVFFVGMLTYLNFIV